MTTPNEPNKARTIPLHIADQAVAACEAEIQKLKEENARLKEKSACQTKCLDAFDKKLREADEMVALMKQKWEWATPSQISEGITLLVENKRLKAEVERLTKAGDELYYWAGAEDCPQRVYDAWNAAKEGKPSV